MKGFRTLQSPISATITIDGKPYTNFAGSSYLGLSGHPDVLAAGAAALRDLGAGYQISREYGITTRAHLEVEEEAAAFFRTEAALYLPAGYLFGLVALGGSRDKLERVFVDELAHHCLRDAIAASGMGFHTFRHLDADDLEAKLKAHLSAGEKPLIATDGMYSVLGEIAPLDRMASLAKLYGGRLLIDESHSAGVLGASGRGAAEHHGIGGPGVLIGGSLTKAFGTTGGVIPGSAAEVAAFRRMPASRGASVGLPAAAAMCAASLRRFREHPEILQRLRENVAYLKREMRGIGLNVGESVAPVASFVSGDEQSMRTLQELLMSEDIFVMHSNYIGAGPAGVIRCGIFADHTREQLDQLVSALKRLL